MSLLVPGDSIFATVADADGVEVRQVAWRRGGTTVSSTLDYTLEASNFGEPLEVNVTYADGMGHTETLSSTILLPSKIPLVRFADLHGQLMTGLRAGANYFLRVSPALVGLPFDVLVDGTAVSSGFAMDYYGLSARAEGETVTVRVNRGNGLTVDSAPLPVATVLLEGPAIVGGTLSATVRGATIMFVEFYFDGSIQSRGSLGVHVLSAQQLGTSVHVVIQDTQGRRYRSAAKELV